MSKMNYQPNYWHYLTGGFLDYIRIIKKSYATLTQKITNRFKYQG